MGEPVIVAATRTPIGRAFKGSLVDVRPDDMAAHVVKSALQQVPELPVDQIDDLLLGCGLPGGEQGYNLARVVSILSDLEHVPGATVTRYCASSLQTIRMAAHSIKADEGDIFIAAGVEAVSRFVKGSSDELPDTKNPAFENAQLRTLDRAGGGKSWKPDHGLPDVYIAMGQTAENVADIEDISREEMDQFAQQSQMRAVAAIDSGFSAREITPISRPDGEIVAIDDGPRRESTLEALGTLKPVFRPDGRVTAGNACPLNDGAAAVIVMSEEKARQFGITPLARVVSSTVSALNPEIMGLGPVEAITKLLARTGKSIEDIDIVEINEAFAAQVIPCMQTLGISQVQLNPNGGAIALGHPFGMTGARIMCTLLNGLQTANKQWGIESMCVGGGQGMAMLIERL